MDVALLAVPDATATIFDLPDAIERPATDGRHVVCRPGEVTAGDFYVDELPDGTDFAWVGAIATSTPGGTTANCSPRCIRQPVPGGRIALRDMVMDADRTRPHNGALFAINMLVNTESGGTFTFESMPRISAAGFEGPEVGGQTRSNELQPRASTFNRRNWYAVRRFAPAAYGLRRRRNRSRCAADAIYGAVMTG